MHDNYDKSFAALTTNLESFVSEVKGKNPNLMATDKWSVKEVLCHIVFWHENYTANYKALSKNSTPPLLYGPGYKLNHDGVALLRKFPVSELIKRLRKANNTLQVAIVEKRVPKMTYKKDGRVYTTSEFLDLITRHLATHTKHVRRTK